jgi:hypothetical protein
MNCFDRVMAFLAVTGVCMAPAAPAKEPIGATAGEGAETAKIERAVVADFEKDKLPFLAHPDGGDPPAFSRITSEPASGAACMRLEYRNGKRGYGNIGMPVELSGAEDAVILRVRKRDAAENAALYVWLFEDDGDQWLSPRTTVSSLKKEWQTMRLALKKFRRYRPKGMAAKLERRRVNKLLVGCNYADFTVCLDDLAFEGRDLAAHRKRMKEHVDLLCEITPDQALRGPLMGVGAEWNPIYSWTDVSEAHWKLIGERVRWMRLPVARVMMLSKWCLDKDGSFDWDSPHMKELYRVLDHCRELHSTVLLTDWGCVRSWTRAPGIKNTADPRYAEVIGAYLDHLVNTKRYDCIRYFILVNEPNNEAGGYEDWVQGVRNVAAEFASRKLDAKVRIAGCDASQCNGGWHTRSIRDLKDVLGAYDLHLYANDSEVRWGRLEARWRKLWDAALKHDPAADRKPFIIGEAGMNDGAAHPRGNRNIDTYWYGVFMADYALQALRAGTHAVNAWMLDDNSHRGFFWGAWSNSAKGLTLRPWFYTWSLLCRFLPPGSTVYRVAVSRDGIPARPALIRTLAVRGPRGGWTFCVVNRERQRQATVIFRVPDRGRTSLKHYVYSEAESPVDGRGFPAPVRSGDIALEDGVIVTCPANAVAISTSISR